MNEIVLLVGAVAVAWIIFMIIFGAIKKTFGLIINGVIGVILLAIFNFFGASFGLTIGINLFTALIAGIFGVPGVIIMAIFKLFF